MRSITFATALGALTAVGCGSQGDGAGPANTSSSTSSESTGEGAGGSNQSSTSDRTSTTTPGAPSGATTSLGSRGGTSSGGSSGTAASSAGMTSSGGTTSSAGMTSSSATSGTGDAGSATLAFSYWLGADVSFEETQPQATRANLLSILKAHGFNAIRLRTFVDPKAADGYDKSGGACDLAHTIDFGKQIKAAGMAFLVDFHYSDNWADPGKQCVPISWQTYTTVADLATAVHDYTKNAITQLIVDGARPDMVQIGNETTPGMLIHRCDAGGSPVSTNPVNGSTSNWANLGALLKAGVDGVKEVDPNVMTSFHIAKGGDHTDGTAALSTSVSWLSNALKYTTADAFGESCYQTYQGDASSASHSQMIWQTTEGGLASKFPKVKIFAAEYGGAEREINDVVFGLPNDEGLGTFYWEPTTAGAWNPGVTLLTRSGSTYTAQPQLSLYDQMKVAYASRL